MKKKMFIISGIVICIILCIALVGNKRNELVEIDLLSFYEVQFYSEDGVGNAYVVIAPENIVREMLLQGKNITREGAVEFVENYINVKLSQSENIQNGDIITMEIECDKEKLKEYGLVLSEVKRKVKVTGLD